MLSANLMLVLILGLLIIIIYYIIFSNQIKTKQPIKEFGIIPFVLIFQLNPF